MTTAPRQRTLRGSIIRLHQWLGLASGIVWLVQGITGMLLSFHFEIDDALMSRAQPATDFAAIEKRMDALAGPDTGGRLVWIWTTAGMPDRYQVNYVTADGTARLAHIDGAGTLLRDAGAMEHTLLRFMRQIHINLAMGLPGHIILIVTGFFLLTNLIFGLVAAWPRPGKWKAALKVSNNGHPVARAFSWHRAIGLWGAVPALIIAGTGTLILLEHEIGDALGVHEISLPALAAEGAPVGVGAAVQAAYEAIPGSRLAGTTIPSEADASYYVWVRAPGELYSNGYGGSLVIVDANTAAVRGAWPVTEAEPAHAFIASFYPIHTGEAAGTFGRVLAMLTGLWLTVMIGLGVLLWLRRRKLRTKTERA